MFEQYATLMQNKSNIWSFRSLSIGNEALQMTLSKSWRPRGQTLAWTMLTSRRIKCDRLTPLLRSMCSRLIRRRTKIARGSSSPRLRCSTQLPIVSLCTTRWGGDLNFDSWTRTTEQVFLWLCDSDPFQQSLVDSFCKMWKEYYTFTWCNFLIIQGLSLAVWNHFSFIWYLFSLLSCAQKLSIFHKYWLLDWS